MTTALGAGLDVPMTSWWRGAFVDVNESPRDQLECAIQQREIVLSMAEMGCCRGCVRCLVKYLLQSRPGDLASGQGETWLCSCPPEKSPCLEDEFRGLVLQCLDPRLVKNVQARFMTAKIVPDIVGRGLHVPKPRKRRRRRRFRRKRKTDILDALPEPSHYCFCDVPTASLDSCPCAIFDVISNERILRQPTPFPLKESPTFQRRQRELYGAGWTPTLDVVLRDVCALLGETLLPVGHYRIQKGWVRTENRKRTAPEDWDGNALARKKERLHTPSSPIEASVIHLPFAGLSLCVEGQDPEPVSWPSPCSWLSSPTLVTDISNLLTDPG